MTEGLGIGYVHNQARNKFHFHMHYPECDAHAILAQDA